MAENTKNCKIMTIITQYNQLYINIIDWNTTGFVFNRTAPITHRREK